MYQTIGEFNAENALPVCWGGRTSRKQEAQDRLAEARQYTERRKQHKGQHIKWQIEQT